MQTGTQVTIDDIPFVRTKLGSEGHAVYGPYQTLDTGRYVVVFTLGVDEVAPDLDDRVCATVDVVSHLGKLIYARREITVGSLGGELAAICLSFDVTEPAVFEFRVQVYGEIQLHVAEQRDLFRLSVPRTNMMRPQATGFPQLTSGPVPTLLLSLQAGFRGLYEKGADIEISGVDILLHANGITSDASDGNLDRVAQELWPRGAYVDISYADAREDVILLKALHDVSRDEGFYIDVGANDPEIISVTKLFYDRGWCGVNVDPSPKWYSRLVAARPRDTNIQAAVSDIAGNVTFFDHADGGLGTVEAKFADRHHADLGIKTEAMIVETLSLAEICEAHAADRPIHFLKIDVEGHEASVLRSMDFAKFRPWILCIEATEPLNVSAKTFQEWDRLVAAARYKLARSDDLNRYYVAVERSYLLERFDSPPQGYILA